MIIHFLDLYWVDPDNSANLPAVLVGGYRVARATVGDITLIGCEKDNLCYASLDDEHYEEAQYEVHFIHHNATITYAVNPFYIEKCMEKINYNG